MRLHHSQLRALVCISLCFNVVTAGLLGHVRRDDATPVSKALPGPTGSQGDGTPTPSVTDRTTTSTSSSSSDIKTTSSSSVLSSTVLPGPQPTTLNETESQTQSTFNTTIAAGELPMHPVITPGWAVAGVILLCTGVVYTLVGIKMQWLHTYFSTAFLTSLGTTVLIVYVMTPPVPVAIQGAYVVAVVLTGMILGGAAIVFKEITEGLGCFLGGFSLSMWLLSLKAGGLLPSTGAKVGFISAFSLASFALYFSKHTRNYGLIACISFAGSTVTVLGIDCFSRAGLKEFWAFIWNLNGNLFPLGADTYPLTKGIKVELAATIIIFMAGIVSQLKLWKVVKERRAKKDAEKAEEDRQLQVEEENVGREVEASNARERDEWEAVYGDGERPGRPREPSSDSGVGDMESEKKARDSHGDVPAKSHHTSVSEEEEIEMKDLSAETVSTASPPKPKGAAELVIAQDARDGVITVRVAKDDVPEGQDAPPPLDEEPKVWYVGGDGEARRVTTSGKRASGTSMGPEIVPLPFRVPHLRDEDEASQADRSSVATFADEDALSGIASKRNSFAKRLSRGSAELLRSMSQRSKRETGPKSPLHSESREDLFASRNTNRDDSSSIAATIDVMNSDSDAYSTHRDSRAIEINAQLGGNDVAETSRKPIDSPANLASLEKEDKDLSVAAVAQSPDAGPSGKEKPIDSSELGNPDAEQGGEMAKEETRTERSAGNSDSGTKKAKSVTSVVSTPASLTKEHLPRSLSKIAMSYRTNEWAKHLSNAEAPAPEVLQLNEYTQEALPTSKVEEAAPVNMEELQQTAATATPAPAAPRSATALSSYPSTASLPVQTLSRSNSKQSMLSIPASQSMEQLPRNGGLSPIINTSTSQPNLQPPYRSFSSAMNRRTSNLSVQPIAEEMDSDQLPDSPALGSEGNKSMPPSPIPETSGFRSPTPGVISYSSPQTLIGKREMFLRSRSHGSLVPPGPGTEAAVLPTIPSQANSEAGSLYNFSVHGQNAPLDVDDLPLNQRKEILRQNSLAALAGTVSRPSSQMSFAPATVPAPLISIPGPSAESIAFNSHQPQRTSGLPPPAAREAQLANFRSSVAAELRAGTPIVPGSGGPGRETPMRMSSVYGNASSASLPIATASRDSEVRRGIDAQRSFLLSQKEAESQKREMERLDKERGDRVFEERMRRGELLDAHQDAMRRMQAQARKG